jgi:hypothetical protein
MLTSKYQQDNISIHSSTTSLAKLSQQSYNFLCKLCGSQEFQGCKVNSYALDYIKQRLSSSVIAITCDCDGKAQVDFYCKQH